MRLSKLLSAAAVAAIISLAVLAPKTSEAGTAANATIRNEVTVNYQNAAGTDMNPKTATVDITILLKPATPTLVRSSGATATTEANAAVDYTYTITTNANGPDTYNLSPSVTADMADVDLTASTATFYSSPSAVGPIASVDLGATTAAATVAIPLTTQTAITVLRDNAATANVLNGLAVDDTVVIGGVVCTVKAVPGGGGYGTTTIDVSCSAAVTVNLGDQIREIQTVYLNVVPGTIKSSATANQTITAVASARDAASIALATTVDASTTTTTTVLLSQVTVIKYVRNVSDVSGTGNAAGGGGTLNINTGGGAGLVDYFITGVKGLPGDTLEYVIEVTNSATGGAAKEVKISDPLNSYITYTPATMRLDPGTGAFGALVDAEATPDAGEFDPATKTVYIYAGTGGADSAATFFGIGTGGTLAASKKSYGVYRVTIN